ncbi:FAR1-related protein, partial [Striga asiatica]
RMNENEIIEEPTLGMVFKSQEEAYSYYSNYGIQKGFGVMKRSSKRGDDEEKIYGEELICLQTFHKNGLVEEDVKVGDIRKVVTFTVHFDESTHGVNCVCRLFEFRGILCRHTVSVLIARKINEVHPRFILPRWRKDLKRRYTLVRIGYNPLSQQIQRCEKMCKALHEVAVIAADDEEKFELVMKGIRELKLKITNDEKKIVQTSFSQPQDFAEQQKVINRTNKVLSPMVTRGKGRPATKRKISRLEVVVQKLKKKNQNKKLKETEPNRLKSTKASTKTLEANSIFGPNPFNATFSNNVVNQVPTYGEYYMPRPPDSCIYPRNSSIQPQEKANPISAFGGYYMPRPLASPIYPESSSIQLQENVCSIIIFTAYITKSKVQINNFGLFNPLWGRSYAMGNNTLQTEDLTQENRCFDLNKDQYPTT